MHTKTIVPLILVLALFIAGCASLAPKKTLLSATDRTSFTDVVESNGLRIQKRPDGEIETLRFSDAIIENKGTEREKKCLCQAVCFRVAQLAAQAWEDGVFRTDEVKRIRTGWNTSGPFEFFSDRELNDEIGDLEIPAEKIRVEKKNGEKATAPQDLTIQDSWYEITFSNGLAVFFQVKEGTNGVYPAGFLKLRNRMEKGDQEAKQSFMPLMKETVAGVAELPFQGIIVESVGSAK